ncbi:hypothetical protein BLNAU_12558 [Blattamonas nauphoetae]|uniref:E2F/DP family winged-helix DNA-binding domain-containing protein n=1 Tax=Blattamonas nauphoetae TaxID=2049346 RepID=A0ABQ9XPC3_9EUKA|nr:hypothetical protein BLNAU_12558 [Blattamonas nauphoetae]
MQDFLQNLSQNEKTESNDENETPKSVERQEKLPLIQQTWNFGNSPNSKENTTSIGNEIENVADSNSIILKRVNTEPIRHGGMNLVAASPFFGQTFTEFSPMALETPSFSSVHFVGTDMGSSPSTMGMFFNPPVMTPGGPEYNFCESASAVESERGLEANSPFIQPATQKQPLNEVIPAHLGHGLMFMGPRGFEDTDYRPFGQSGKRCSGGKKGKRGKGKKEGNWAENGIVFPESEGGMMLGGFGMGGSGMGRIFLHPIQFGGETKTRDTLESCTRVVLREFMKEATFSVPWDCGRALAEQCRPRALSFKQLQNTTGMDYRRLYDILGVLCGTGLVRRLGKSEDAQQPYLFSEGAGLIVLDVWRVGGRGDVVWGERKAKEGRRERANDEEEGRGKWGKQGEGGGSEGMAPKEIQPNSVPLTPPSAGMAVVGGSGRPESSQAERSRPLLPRWSFVSPTHSQLSPLPSLARHHSTLSQPHSLTPTQTHTWAEHFFTSPRSPHMVDANHAIFPPTPSIVESQQGTLTPSSMSVLSDEVGGGEVPAQIAGPAENWPMFGRTVTGTGTGKGVGGVGWWRGGRREFEEDGSGSQFGELNWSQSQEGLSDWGSAGGRVGGGDGIRSNGNGMALIGEASEEELVEVSGITKALSTEVAELMTLHLRLQRLEWILEWVKGVDIGSGGREHRKEEKHDERNGEEGEKAQNTKTSSMSMLSSEVGDVLGGEWAGQKNRNSPLSPLSIGNQKDAGARGDVMGDSSEWEFRIRSVEEETALKWMFETIEYLFGVMAGEARWVSGLIVGRFLEEQRLFQDLRLLRERRERWMEREREREKEREAGEREELERAWEMEGDPVMGVTLPMGMDFVGGMGGDDFEQSLLFGGGHEEPSVNVGMGMAGSGVGMGEIVKVKRKEATRSWEGEETGRMGMRELAKPQNVSRRYLPQTGPGLTLPVQRRPSFLTHPPTTQMGGQMGVGVGVKVGMGVGGREGAKEKEETPQAPTQPPIDSRIIDPYAHFLVQHSSIRENVQESPVPAGLNRPMSISGQRGKTIENVGMGLGNGVMGWWGGQRRSEG